MNNIQLLKEYDPGTGRMRQPGQKMRVDNATKERLIKEGIAISYSEEIQVKTKKKTTKLKPAKATVEEAAAVPDGKA